MPYPITGAESKRPWLRLAMNTSQSISNNSLTVLSFDTVSASNRWPNPPAVPATSITLPYSGLVLIIAHDMDWHDAGDGVGARHLGHRKNADVNTSRMGDIRDAVAAAANVQTVQSFVDATPYTAGETLQIVVKQTSGNTLSGTPGPGLNNLTLIYLDIGVFPFSGTN